MFTVDYWDQTNVWTINVVKIYHHLEPFVVVPNYHYKSTSKTNLTKYKTIPNAQRHEICLKLVVWLVKLENIDKYKWRDQRKIVFENHLPEHFLIKFEQHFPVRSLSGMDNAKFFFYPVTLNHNRLLKSNQQQIPIHNNHIERGQKNALLKHLLVWDSNSFIVDVKKKMAVNAWLDQYDGEKLQIIFKCKVLICDLATSFTFF